jgi:hypothetical protein
MKTWIEALKDYNTGSSVWAIPRTGTGPHAFVKRIMSGMTNVNDKVQLIEKKIKKNKKSMRMIL